MRADLLASSQYLPGGELLTIYFKDQMGGEFGLEDHAFTVAGQKGPLVADPEILAAVTFGHPALGTNNSIVSPGAQFPLCLVSTRTGERSWFWAVWWKGLRDASWPQSGLHGPFDMQALPLQTQEKRGPARVR